MEIKLKVCPFCGSKAELIDESDDWYSKYATDYEWASLLIKVQCPNCGANIQADDNDAKEDVINQWNTRAILDEAYEFCDNQVYTPEEQADNLLRLIEKYNL